MSRLDSAIRRLAAQRDCLGMAAELIGDMPGPILELGLGNGRTYDHLRALFPGREIFVFDRHVAAHPDCIPDDTHMIIGDVMQTLGSALDRIGARAAMVHSDIGSGDKPESRRRARALTRLLGPLLVPGAIAVSDQDMASAGWPEVALPEGIAPGRYYVYRVP